MSRISHAIRVLLLLLLLPSAQADERILSFHSDISVNSDGSMQVEETIQVMAEQNQIRRGIYREFPTTYRDSYGNSYRVDFQVTGVLRDGTTENYFTQSQSDGVRVYFGRENVLLSPGIYTYTFSYHTNRQLGFFDGHDELYWNVTGNGWDFPIDRASARVFLPDTVPSNSVQAEAYTGVSGSTEQAFEDYRSRGGSVFIEAARPLVNREGLTIVVSWPKGFVNEPSFEQRLEYFYQDNRHIIAGSIGMLVLIIYYLLVWYRVGKDPLPGVVVTRYLPPEAYSPASLRYVRRMGYDNTCFSVALINLAVKGYLKILEHDDEYTLERTGQDVSMSPGEAELVKRLFGSQGKTLKLETKNHVRIKEAMTVHEASLERNYELNYFVTNSGYFILGVVLTIVILIAAILMMPDWDQAGGSLFIILWLSGWSVGVFFLIKTAIQAWRRVKGVVTVIAAIHITVFAMVFTGVEVFVFFTFGQWLNWAFMLIILTGAGLNWLFYELLKAPTLAGRRLLDKIEGFHHFIDVAGKQELEGRFPGGRSPQLFESYLPYALALGVEQKWAEKFADVLTKISSSGKVSYRPLWYSGAGWDNNHIGGFTSSLGRHFGSAIASSSSPPGSSSGSGGGGSSGGGGGGGGGGGW